MTLRDVPADLVDGTLYVDAINADGVPFEGGAESIPWQVWSDEC
jgi:hypothetical protein